MQEIEKVISNFPLFKEYSEKEKFFKVLGLLIARQISLAKAAELLDMQRNDFILLLDRLKIEYSYLDEEEINKEKETVNRLLRESQSEKNTSV